MFSKTYYIIDILYKNQVTKAKQNKLLFRVMPGGFHITGAGEYGDCPEDCPSDTNQGDLNFLHYLKNALWYIDPSGHFVFYELFFSLKALTRKIFKLNF